MRSTRNGGFNHENAYAISLPDKYPIVFVPGDTYKIVSSSTVTAGNWKQAECPSRKEWINKSVVQFPIKYYSVLEINDLKLQAKTWWIPETYSLRWKSKLQKKATVGCNLNPVQKLAKLTIY